MTWYENWVRVRVTEGSEIWERMGKSKLQFECKLDTYYKVLMIRDPEDHSKSTIVPIEEAEKILQGSIREREFPKKWQTYPELPGYQVKFIVDNPSGVVIGFYVALATEPKPDHNHVHYYYDNKTQKAAYHMTAKTPSGKSHFSSVFADHVINDLEAKLPSLAISKPG